MGCREGRRGTGLGSVALVTILLAGCATAVAERSDGLIDLRITQRYLKPLCLDSTPVDTTQRTLRVPPGAHSMRFTMRNEPREGMGGGSASPGNATIRFTLDAGDRYEVEVRAPEMSFSRRVWRRGSWTPVVRDRTTDRVVSHAATWGAAACDAGGSGVPENEATGVR